MFLHNRDTLAEDDFKGALTEDADARSSQKAEEQTEDAEKRRFLSELKDNPALMITTTGSTFDGIRIESYLGTLSTDGIVGSGIPSKLDAIVSDLSGERSIELAQKMERAKGIAWEELLWRAHKLGANGIVGIRYDVYMPFSGAFGASVTATAVSVSAFTD